MRLVFPQTLRSLALGLLLVGPLGTALGQAPPLNGGPLTFSNPDAVPSFERPRDPGVLSERLNAGGLLPPTRPLLLPTPRQINQTRSLPASAPRSQPGPASRASDGRGERGKVTVGGRRFGSEVFAAHSELPYGRFANKQEAAEALELLRASLELNRALSSNSARVMVRTLDDVVRRLGVPGNRRRVRALQQQVKALYAMAWPSSQRAWPAIKSLVESQTMIWLRDVGRIP